MDTIINAKNNSLKDSTSALPNVAEAVMQLLQPVVVKYIQKQTSSGYTEEILVTLNTKASIQPSKQDLDIQPVGQRAWKYWTVFVLSNLNLQPDEIFSIDGVHYRIISRRDWSKFGYYQYETIEDYDYNAPDTTDNS